MTGSLGPGVLTSGWRRAPNPFPLDHPLKETRPMRATRYNRIPATRRTFLCGDGDDARLVRVSRPHRGDDERRAIRSSLAVAR